MGRWSTTWALMLLGFALGCGGDDAGGGSAGSGSGDSSEGGEGGEDDDLFGNADRDAALPDREELQPPVPNPDAFWADDPPPMSCQEDGTMGPPPQAPGGTPECPDDKNREGCPCDSVGETSACWPGLRANRNRGMCRDGETECMPFGEFGGAWGRCLGYVLPQEGATAGAAACRCFSRGRWEIDNLSPCFITYSDGAVYAVSTAIGEDGAASCPSDPGWPPPQPEPASVWSTSRLTVDCAGRFELCYTIKAGDMDNASASDCVLARTCVETWYEEADVTQELNPLPPWSTDDPACAQELQERGGYGEMTVRGLSVECDEIDDGDGGEYVFNRVNYCPTICNQDPNAAGCETCRMGGSGDF